MVDVWRSLSLAALMACSLLFVGCYDPYANEKQCYKIVGTVTVDGNRSRVYNWPCIGGRGRSEAATFPQGQTGAEGKVKFSTYADGDGAPPGDYKLTATWQEFNPIARGFSGPDKTEKYADPATTTVTIKLPKNSPMISVRSS